MDIAHIWGADMQSGPTGDLALVDGMGWSQQRLLRRLLTNPGDYVWHPEYGAGLARFIGQPGNEQRIRAVIRGQIFREAAVARTPEPVIDVRVSPDGAAGTVYVHIRYVDAPSGRTEILSFNVEA